MKSTILIFLVGSALVLGPACGNYGSRYEGQEVVLDGHPKLSGEVYIEEKDINEPPRQIILSTAGSQAAPRLLSDKSEIITAFDGYGNKSETRYFKDDLRLRFVLLRTSPNGDQQVTVYGHGSDTKIVDGLGDRAMTASSEEIANLAGMFATKSEREVGNFMKPWKNAAASEQPLPSSELPVNAPSAADPAAAPPAESAETATALERPEPSDGKTPQPEN